MAWRLRLLLLLSCLVAGSVSVASANESVLDVVRATFKVVNKTSTATSFVVVRPAPSDKKQPGSDTRKPELFLVTGAHVFERMSGDTCRIVLRQQRGEGIFVRREVPIPIRSNNKPLWVRHPKMDVAALKLKLPADHGIAGLPIDQIVKEPTARDSVLRVADRVWIPCYPAQLEANKAGFPILRQGTVASFPLSPVDVNPTFLVDYNTFAGDSGAPVMASGREDSGAKQQPAMIVGIVVAQNRVTTKSVSPFEQRTVHRPLGVAIVIHAKFIRETIDRLAN